MEELVLDYIQDMVRAINPIAFLIVQTNKAMQVATRRGKLQTEDLVFLIRKDRKKHARVKELLIMYAPSLYVLSFFRAWLDCHLPASGMTSLRELVRPSTLQNSALCGLC